MEQGDPFEIRSTGLGGSMNICFACNSCKLRTVNFQGSALVEGTKRTVVGMALAVAFVITGHGFAKFDKALHKSLGISVSLKNRYYEVIKLIYPHVTDILDEMCFDKKEHMKAIPAEQLGIRQMEFGTIEAILAKMEPLL